MPQALGCLLPFPVFSDYAHALPDRFTDPRASFRQQATRAERVETSPSTLGSS